MDINKASRYQVAKIICLLLWCACFDVYAGDIEDAGKLFREGQHAQALVKIESYLTKNPKDATARFLKGLIYTEQGKTADAIEIFRGLTEDYPEYPEPFNNLAVLYAGQEQYDKAKIALESAIRTHPSYATAHENLGDIYAKLASQAYDRALKLDRGNTSSQTKLNMIQNLFVEEVREQPARDMAKAPTAESPKPAAVAAPQPVPAPVEVKTPPKVTATEVAKEQKPQTTIADVLMAVDAWAAAWSAQDTKKYLSHYASDFETQDKQSRSEWEASRNDRLTKPRYIKVTLSNKKVTLADSEHATVTFLQSYRASHLNVVGRKTLRMVKTDGRWLIRDEQSR